MHESVLSAALLAASLAALYADANAQSRERASSRPASGPSAASRPSAARDAAAFRQVSRPGSVDIVEEYDLSQLSIPSDQIHTLLPRDSIPALTNPATEAVDAAHWLADTARIVVIENGDDVLGVPISILDWHEVVNVDVGGAPVAVTYCPLCDSAAVFSRRLAMQAEGEASPREIVLEFGVSGALYNSNVLMYDKRDNALWSQVAMEAVSGPLAGSKLVTWPVDVVTFRAFRETHPSARLVSRETGHERTYGSSPYAAYFEREALMVPVQRIGGALPAKTLGIGLATETGAWFVPAAAIDGSHEVRTDLGVVTLVRSDDRLAVTDAPDGVRSVQTFYYAWSAFFPNGQVVPVPK